MTPIEEMMEHLVKYDYFIGNDLLLKYEELLQKEKQMVKNAVMHALDEDGHTGEWKIDFANKYYDSIKD
jgi:hypothetical protein